MGSTPPGWYHAEADPPQIERYWDGSVWTDEHRQAGTPFSLPHLAQGGPGQSQHFIESNLAGLGNRIGARVLDIIIWVVIGLFLQVPLIFLVGQESVNAQLDGVRLPLWVSLVQITAVVVQLILVVSYEALFSKNFTSTLGKKVTSTKIVKLDGSPMSLVDHLKRMSPYLAIALTGSMISSLVPQETVTVLSLSIGLAILQIVLGIVGIAMVASDDREQALWDKISKTTVIHDR